MALESKPGICPGSWCLLNVKAIRGETWDLAAVRTGRRKAQPVPLSRKRRPLGGTQPVREGKGGTRPFAVPSRGAWESSGCPW